MNLTRYSVLSAVGIALLAACSSASAPSESAPAAASTPVATHVAGRQQLTGHRTPEMTRAPIVGRVDAETPLTLTIGLAIKNSAALLDAAAQVSDPKSPAYGRSITPAQFAATFGADPADYQAVLDWAKAKGLDVTTHANGVPLPPADDQSHPLSPRAPRERGRLCRSTRVGVRVRTRTDACSTVPPWAS